MTTCAALPELLQQRVRVRLRNYDNKHFTSCKRAVRGGCVRCKWGDEGKVTSALKNNLMVVITGLLLRMTSISLPCDSTSARLSFNSFSWQIRMGENKLEMIPRALYKELFFPPSPPPFFLNSDTFLEKKGKGGRGLLVMTEARLWLSGKVS